MWGLWDGVMTGRERGADSDCDGSCRVEVIVVGRWGFAWELAGGRGNGLGVGLG